MIFSCVLPFTLQTSGPNYSNDFNCASYIFKISNLGIKTNTCHEYSACICRQIDIHKCLHSMYHNTIFTYFKDVHTTDLQNIT